MLIPLFYAQEVPSGLGGDNDKGQLGDGTTIDKLYPIEVNASSWLSISAGDDYTVAIKSDNTLWAWGSNSIGQLGHSPIGSNSDTPVQEESNSTNWKSITANVGSKYKSHTIAYKNDGSLWSWGDNGSGQLGQDDTTDRSTPTQIGAGIDWSVHLSAGEEHTAVIKSDGSLWTWGNNYDGQLGDNTKVDKIEPIEVNSSTWLEISSGLLHTVAIRDDGTLWAWGDNSYGQLGHSGSVYDSEVPLQEASMDSTWVKVSAGNYNTVAIKKDGTLWSWGSASYGQIGDGYNYLRPKMSQPRKP